MPLVALDSMIFDLIQSRLDVTLAEADAAEALMPPPEGLQPEAEAVYWLLALARYWRSCVYTCSDHAYRELSQIPAAKRGRAERLTSIAAEIREDHPPELRTVNDWWSLPASELESLGIRPADARHLADAIGMGASYFLTLDKGILRKGSPVKDRWSLWVMSPSEFLHRSVRAGAPWPAAVPWPWDADVLAPSAS